MKSVLTLIYLHWGEVDKAEGIQVDTGCIIKMKKLWGRGRIE